MAKKRKPKSKLPNVKAIEDRLRQLTFERGYVAYHETDKIAKIDKEIAQLQVQYVKAGG